MRATRSQIRLLWLLPCLAAALLVLGWVQAGHFHGHEEQGTAEHDEHCELCLQFSRLAGPQNIDVRLQVVLAWAVVLVAARCTPIATGVLHAYFARGPPAR